MPIIGKVISPLVHLGSVLGIKLPTSFTASFVIDTILGQLNWVNNSGESAQYEVYSSTNGGTYILLATTAAGATSYQDTLCKQNASVTYKIRVKKGSAFSDYVAATTINTPLCLKTNQSTLTQVTINEIVISAGKTVVLNWGDGTSESLTWSTSNKSKNYGATGQYNIWLSGDTNFITSFKIRSQARIIGDVGNWLIPSSIWSFWLDATGVTGNAGLWTLPTTLISLFINNTSLSGNVSAWVFPSTATNIDTYATSLSGAIPQITPHATNALSFRMSVSAHNDCGATTFRKAMSTFNIGSQTVSFSTANIDKTLKALADYYQANAPTANCTFTLSGTNMGIPTGAASNVDLLRLVGYYTAASKTATVLVRTS